MVETLPKVYTTVEEEYRAAKTSVAVVDRSRLGKFKITGADRHDIMHRATTQYFFYKNKDTRNPCRSPADDPDALEVGEGVSTVLTTPKARIVDHLVLYCREDSFLVLTGEGNAANVVRYIDQYIFREDFQMEEVTEQLGAITVVGPQAASLLEGLARQSVAPLRRHHFVPFTFNDGEALAAKTWAFAGDAYNLITPTANVCALWTALTGRGGKPLGEAAFEILRVEAGVPALGKELSEEVNPWDARLDESIHSAKGCYVGQEVIARIQTYQKVNKHLLAGFRLSAPVEAGSKVAVGGREVGELTSVVQSPGFGVIALGYIHGAHDDPGVKVEVEGVEGEVAGLPFRGPSVNG